MNNYKNAVGWSVADGAERQYGKFMLYVLGNICVELTEGKHKNVVFSPYREKTTSDVVKKLEWRDDTESDEPPYLIENRQCTVTGMLKKVKIPAKSVVAYCVKMREHDDFIEVFSILSNEHLVPLDG